MNPESRTPNERRGTVLGSRLTVSVIIPTKNRAEDLEITILSLASQTILPDEVIIVDQSPGGESQNVVERVFERNEMLRSEVHLVYKLRPEISGGAEARNHAMDLAASDVWLFLDDDVELEADFIEELLRCYESRPDASGISGIITNYPRPPIAMRCWASLFARGPFADDRQPVYWHSGVLSDAEPIRVTRLGGGLMSFRADVVRSIRFDADLRGVSDGEDVDFCSRLSDQVLLIAPRARLEHRKSSSERLTDHWLRRSSRATSFLYHRNWRRGLRNRLCYAWLSFGYAMTATWASLRRGSLDPWRALLAGLAEGRVFKTRRASDARSKPNGIR